MDDIIKQYLVPGSITAGVVGIAFKLMYDMVKRKLLRVEAIIEIIDTDDKAKELNQILSKDIIKRCDEAEAKIKRTSESVIYVSNDMDKLKSKVESDISAIKDFHDKFGDTCAYKHSELASKSILDEKLKYHEASTQKSLDAFLKALEATRTELREDLRENRRILNEQLTIIQEQLIALTKAVLK